MSKTMVRDPELGLVPAIPEPYWYWGWRTLFRFRPECLRCNKLFKTRRDWDIHYVLTHLQNDEAIHES
jgi:hypothetical protein